MKYSELYKNTLDIQKEVVKGFEQAKPESPEIEYQNFAILFLLNKVSELQRRVDDLSSRSYPTLGGRI